MKVLAIDSSGLVASIAIAEDDRLIAEYTIQYKKTHSQTLLPMLEEVAKMVDLDLASIDIIAVSQGPGSFTGLRIGAATVKGLGFALQKSIVGVPTIESLANQLYGVPCLICPIMDARRGQVYTGLYRFEEKRVADSQQELFEYRLQTQKEQCIAQIDEIAEIINQMGEIVIFTGDGIPVYREQLASLMTVPYSFAPLNRNRQSAASIATLGYRYYKEGKITKAGDFHPEYLRLSQAERERKEKSEENAGNKGNDRT